MENLFKKFPVSSTFKNVTGYIPSPTCKGALADKLLAVYADGLCGALEKKGGKSYVDFTQETVGRLTVLEFTAEHNGKRLKFSHVYDGLFPWKISKEEINKICKALKPQIIGRRSFDESIFADAETALKEKLRRASVIPSQRGYKIVFKKGLIANRVQIFNLIFEK